MIEAGGSVTSPGECDAESQKINSGVELQHSRKKIAELVSAFQKINQSGSSKAPPPAELTAWIQALESVTGHDEENEIKPRPLSQVIPVAALVGIIAALITWFVTLLLTPTIYMGVGLALGIFGVARQNAESAAIGGVLAKTLAWYLAPTIDSLTQLTRYIVSVTLAAFLEYPFLTFSNALALKRKTAMKLRAIQDAADVTATFIMVSTSGLGKVDAFSVSQTLLALLRVVVVVLGPRFLLSSTLKGPEEIAGEESPKPIQALTNKEKAFHKRNLIKLYTQLKDSRLTNESDNWIKSLQEELEMLPTVGPFHSIMLFICARDALVCMMMTALGILLGAVGLTVSTGPYVLGIASVLGMGLAWYVGPSLKNKPFILKWMVSLLLMSTLEYPFLTEANNRAGETQTTFELRAVQDLAGLAVSTILIVVLSKVTLNRIDAIQLAIGAFRVVVATKFFGSVSS